MKRKVLQAVISLLVVIFLAVLTMVLVRTRHISIDAKPVLATNFVAYDLARALMGEEKVEMLVPPGVDIHNFEPTPADIQKLAKTKLLIYNGVESESWVEKLLNDFKGETFKMMDNISELVIESELPAGSEPSDPSQAADEVRHSGGSHEGEVEYDEHVFVSPKNMMQILKNLTVKLVQVDPENQSNIQQKAESYLKELEALDREIEETIQNGKRQVLIFGDKFPLAYFVRDYHLKAFSAFAACSDEAEPDSQILSQLIDKIKSEHIPVVFKLEHTGDRIAKAITNETGAKILPFYSFHFISSADYKAGKTYLDLWRENITVLREALN